MAASPLASTPGSASSPPPLAMKAPSVSINGNAPAPSITSREWVIPPRPKPGRKPATDTPPTKRKAQNRAAQRAFRERRAARVGELEDYMKDIEDKNSDEQDQLRENIKRLETDVKRFQGEVITWRNRCGELDQTLQRERASRTQLETDVALRQQRVSVAEGDAVPLHRRPPPSQDLPPEQHFDQGPDSELMGCGNCTSGSRCECIEQALNVSPPAQETTTTSNSKRPHSPELSSSLKRYQGSRGGASIKPDPAELETDFTHLYSSNGAPQPAEEGPPPAAPVSPLPASEQCGFCQDGTPCVCAELESQAATAAEENRLAPLLSQFTPPPSETDVQSSHAAPVPKPRPIHPSIHRPVSSNPCANGPGTCAQCMSDPNSTIFCKSLAAARSLPAPAGGPSANGGCCKSGSASSQGGCCRSEPQSQANGPTLSCADAYTTLSRHPHYSEATDELSSWLGHLRTDVPSRDGKDRPPMEVEAASVMGVLKVFDRRFGRE